MNNETLEALKKSIEHWKTMVETGWEKEKPFGEYCALCEMFFDEVKVICTQCPIKKAGHSYCDGTPYEDAWNAYRHRDRPAFTAAAKREVAFLESLLPKENQP